MSSDAKPRPRRAKKTPKPETPGLLLKEIRFRRDHRCFRRGRKLAFRPGVNLLVGDQGAGKSTVLQLVTDLGKQSEAEHTRKVIEVSTEQCRVAAFDFENDNPRTKGYFMDFPGAATMQIMSKFQSHGEAVNVLLGGLASRQQAATKRCDPVLVVLDEPDMALSPRSAHQLARMLQTLADDGRQVLAAVHNPIVIASQPDVFSLEHKRWMTSAKFLAAHAQIVEAPAEPAEDPA